MILWPGYSGTCPIPQHTERKSRLYEFKACLSYRESSSPGQLGWHSKTLFKKWQCEFISYKEHYMIILHCQNPCQVMLRDYSKFISEITRPIMHYTIALFLLYSCNEDNKQLVITWWAQHSPSRENLLSKITSFFKLKWYFSKRKEVKYRGKVVSKGRENTLFAAILENGI